MISSTPPHNPNELKNANEEFIKLFGKEKDAYIDSLVEMSPSELNEECTKYDLPLVQRHI